MCTLLSWNYQKTKFDFDLRPSSGIDATSCMAEIDLNRCISCWDACGSSIAAKIIKSK